MSSQRFAPEFKDEAVRQVLERGYPVTEVAQRLGVSAHSLYKWIKAVKPNKSDQQATEQERDASVTHRPRNIFSRSCSGRERRTSRRSMKRSILPSESHEMSASTPLRVGRWSSRWMGWMGKSC